MGAVNRPGTRERDAGRQNQFITNHNLQSNTRERFLEAKQQRLITNVILLLIILALSILVGLNRQKVFYNLSHNSLADIWRVLFMFLIVFLGLLKRGCKYYDYKKDPKPAIGYIGYLKLLVISTLILFVSLHTFLSTDNWLFYPVAGVLMYLFGRYPEFARNYILKLLKKLEKNSANGKRYEERNKGS
jgi:hypothetical protein